MNTKTKYTMILAVAALALPLSWANAAAGRITAPAPGVSLDFLNNPNNQTGAAPATLTLNPGGTFTLQLDLVSTNTRTDTVDYWLSQFSGPMAGVFSITKRDLTTSSYGNAPSSTDAAVASPTDTKNNTTNGLGSDGVPDNQLNPRNGFDLGAGTPNAGSPGGDLPPGTYQVAIFTLSIAPGATLGTYDLRSYDYTGRGWSDTTSGISDQPFAAQAEILINLVPEPATWSLLGLGGLGALGIGLLRARRKLS